MDATAGTIRIGVRVDDKLRREMERRKEERDQSFSSQVREALEAWFAGDGSWD